MDREKKCGSQVRSGNDVKRASFIEASVVTDAASDPEKSWTYVNSSALQKSIRRTAGQGGK